MFTLKLPDRFKRTATAAAAVIAAGVVAFFLATTGYDVFSGTGSVWTVSVPVPVDRLDGAVTTTGGGLSDRATVDSAGAVDLKITDPSLGEHLLHLLTWLPDTLVFIALAIMLFRLLHRTRRQEPFSGWTVQSLRAMGYVTLVGGSLAAVLAVQANNMLSGSVLEGGPVTGLRVPVEWLVGGIAILALADIMTRGQRMREDLDEVI